MAPSLFYFAPKRVWVLAYLAGHRSLDPGSQAIGAATVLISWGFGAYALVRRVRRGPQN